ncbi:NUDIX hydrolase [Fluviispira multicolorata]|uniref:NUDIX domain-containing protein n=1 Tax=Fluviispira multicolorata TaxID=2654512 RepID=A0A833JCG6_9BACT|nr:NUDIX hydrolase [Fluviispira multicolorata]KAB8030781.1 NUDIX domain-containing protein [Fluviispira multicolorata]
MSLSTKYDNREIILKALQSYKEKSIYGIFQDYEEQKSEQIEVLLRLKTFIENEANCFLRSNLCGHVTGSAVVVNKNFTKVLMTFHAKLKKWLQLGGHCDGDHLIHNVALREANEESGSSQLHLLNYLNFPNIHNLNNLEDTIPFDIDIHKIPERGNEPTHLHYDIRYLIIAENENDILISEESIDLKWIPINEIHNYTSEYSTIRQFNKLKILIRSIK